MRQWIIGSIFSLSVAVTGCGGGGDPIADLRGETDFGPEVGDTNDASGAIAQVRGVNELDGAINGDLDDDSIGDIINYFSPPIEQISETSSAQAQLLKRASAAFRANADSGNFATCVVRAEGEVTLTNCEVNDGGLQVAVNGFLRASPGQVAAELKVSASGTAGSQGINLKAAYKMGINYSAELVDGGMSSETTLSFGDARANQEAVVVFDAIGLSNGNPVSGRLLARYAISASGNGQSGSFEGVGAVVFSGPPTTAKVFARVEASGAAAAAN